MKCWLLVKRVALASALMVGASASMASNDDGLGKYRGHQETKKFISEMVSEHGFDQRELEALFAGVKYKDNIIRLMTRPAEAKPWKEYRPIFVTKQRIKQGLDFMEEHRETLRRAETIFGVPQEVITAIIGVETRYGRNKGSFRVMDALSTLAFDYPKRSAFFRKELSHFLLLARDQSFNPMDLKGSYAGAMGYGQFIPSSFRAYAIDFDGDGIKDIWNNPVDAIGSVANYFHKHGWKPGEQVVAKAKASGDAFDQYVVKKRKDLKPRYSLSELAAVGFEVKGDAIPDQPATAMAMDGKKGWEYWVGLHNFYVITRYNHSSLYAMAVYQLSQSIAKYDRDRTFES